MKVALANAVLFWIIFRSFGPGGVFSSPTAVFTATPANLTSEAIDSIKRLHLTPKDPVEITDPNTNSKQVLHGRFLHITDLHPDRFYKPGLSVDDMCHSGKGSASKYGDAILGCDSPLELVEETLDWVKENLHDKIDFIVWTGDNMRHDNDRRHPRSERDIFEMNEKVAAMFYERFGLMPIPLLGNNDVFPHNLFSTGPTLQTREFYKLWRQFLPASQLHVFERGVYFFQEVIPNQLAVLSINTLYWFQSNPLVDSCDRKKDPGYKLFEWLGVVLKEMRLRNMKVWLTGHVPPNAKNYDISCLRKYMAWSHEYRDIIIGGLYGHMNIDHFIPLDAKQAYKSFQKKYLSLGFEQDVMLQDLDDDELDFEEDNDNLVELESLYDAFNSSIGPDSLDPTDDFVFNFSHDVRVLGGVPYNKVDYMERLRETLYADIKRRKKSGVEGERYLIAHVTASVVPTFNPGLRVWEYNISTLHEAKNIRYRSWDKVLAEADAIWDDNGDSPDYLDEFATFEDKVEILKRDKTIPRKMPKGTALGPAYVPQLFTPERYVQYYLDLEGVNAGKKPFEYELEYTTDDKIYKLPDLTVKNWLRLGRRIGKSAGKQAALGKLSSKIDKLWTAFLHRTFVASDYENKNYG